MSNSYGQPSTFSQPNGSQPMGLWDPNKATGDFQGGSLYVGGSMPEEGRSPFDEYTMPSSLSGNDFYNLPTYGDMAPIGSKG